MEFEAKASVLKICEPTMVPGLLQTEDYARAIFSAGGSSDVDSLVATRMARQEVVSRPNPPLVLVLLDEGAIDRPVGGRREVMSDQLGRLLDVSALPHVMLRIVPKSAGYHVGLEGAFKVLTVGSIDVAYTDAGGGGRLIMDAAEVRTFGIRFDRVGTDALSRSSTRTLIEQVRESLT